MKCEHCGTDVPSHELGRAEYHDCLEDMPIGGDMGGVHTKQMVEDLVSGQAFKNIELEAEISRLRDLLDYKGGSSIRVELPDKANGYKCYVTCQRPQDEERIAGILAESLNLLAKVALAIDTARAKNRIYKKEIKQMNRALRVQNLVTVNNAIIKAKRL